MTTENILTIEQTRERLRASLAAVGDLRPGSLVERHRRCGKAHCRCAKPAALGHRDWILTRAVQCKTVTRAIPPAALALTRQQVAEYRRFRELVKQFVETSTAVCEAKLQATKAAPETETEKKSSRKPSLAKSPPRSRR